MESSVTRALVARAGIWSGGTRSFAFDAAASAAGASSWACAGDVAPHHKAIDASSSQLAPRDRYQGFTGHSISGEGSGRRPMVTARGAGGT